MEKNLSLHKQPIAGLDIVKFIAALLVVAVHSEAVNAPPPPIYELFNPIIQSAVPMFFVISAFLVFRKILATSKCGEQIKILLHFTKRLAILYLFWMIVETPLVFHARHYLSLDLWKMPFAFLKDILFCSTFHGSWFLSALVVGTWMIWGLSKIFGKKLTWLISLIISLYAYHAAKMPISWQIPNVWYTIHFQTPQNSFPVSLMWLCLGSTLAKPERLPFNKSYTSLLWTICVGSYILVILHVDMRLFMVLSLFLLAYHWKLGYKPVFKTMRQSSILIFMIHFIYISIFRILAPQVEWLQHGIILYVILCILSLLTALVTIKMKDYKYLGWLRYGI